MFRIHGIRVSSNTAKTIYVAEELGVNYEFQSVNILLGENKKREFLDRHPMGKLPTLQHGDHTLFESGAICRYLASTQGSPLYPLANHMRRSHIDQWMDFFSGHLGRWLATYAYETVAKVKYDMGDTNPDVVTRALYFIEQQIPVIENHMTGRKWLLGNEISLCDIFAFSYLEDAEKSDLTLEGFPNIQNWFHRLQKREAICRGQKVLLGSRRVRL